MRENFTPLKEDYRQLDGKKLQGALVFPSPQPRSLSTLYASIEALNTDHRSWYSKRQTRISEQLTHTTEDLPMLSDTPPILPQFSLPTRRPVSTQPLSVSEKPNTTLLPRLEEYPQSKALASRESEELKTYSIPKRPVTFADLPPLPMPAVRKQPVARPYTLPPLESMSSAEDVSLPRKIHSFADVLFMLLSPEKWRITKNIKKYLGTVQYKKFRLENHQRSMNNTMQRRERNILTESTVFA